MLHLALKAVGTLFQLISMKAPKLEVNATRIQSRTHGTEDAFRFPYKDRIRRYEGYLLGKGEVIDCLSHKREEEIHSWMR